MKPTRAILLTAALIWATGCDKREETAASDFAAAENLDATANRSDAESPAGQGLEFCPVVDRRIAPADCEDLARIESQVTRGAAAFNVPSPMTRDETKSITLVVDRRPLEAIEALDAAKGAEPEIGNLADAINAEDNATEADMSENVVDDREVAGEIGSGGGGSLPSGSPDPTPQQMVEGLEGETATLTPKVGRYMSAELTGDGFRIEALTPGSQEIPPDSQASWQWNVTPTAGGRHSLTLRTVVDGEVGGKRYPLARTQTVKTVSVDVSWWGKLRDALTAAPAWLKLLTLALAALATLIFTIHKVRKAIRGEDPDK